jgi:hypothetical protein
MRLRAKLDRIVQRHIHHARLPADPLWSADAVTRARMMRDLGDGKNGLGTDDVLKS